MSQPRYTYKYGSQSQQMGSIQRTNYVAANGVFHMVSVQRLQPFAGLTVDSEVSGCLPFPLPLWGTSGLHRILGRDAWPACPPRSS